MTISTPTTSGQILTSAYVNNNINSGMVHITSTTVTGANPTITGAFSSEYTNYKILFSNLICSSDTNFYLRMGTTAGTAYYWAGINREWVAASTTGSQGNGVAQWATGIIGNGTNKTGGFVELQNPNATQPTTFSSQGGDTRTNGAGAVSYSGFLNNSTQYTSFSLLLDGANTITSCTISVYGYRIA
jgi:hypothetical protein